MVRNFGNNREIRNLRHNDVHLCKVDKNISRIPSLNVSDNSIEYQKEKIKKRKYSYLIDENGYNEVVIRKPSLAGLRQQEDSPNSKKVLNKSYDSIKVKVKKQEDKSKLKALGDKKNVLKENKLVKINSLAVPCKDNYKDKRENKENINYNNYNNQNIYNENNKNKNYKEHKEIKEIKEIKEKEIKDKELKKIAKNSIKTSINSSCNENNPQHLTEYLDDIKRELLQLEVNHFN